MLLCTVCFVVVLIHTLCMKLSGICQRNYVSSSKYSDDCTSNFVHCCKKATTYEYISSRVDISTFLQIWCPSRIGRLLRMEPSKVVIICLMKCTQFILKFETDFEIAAVRKIFPYTIVKICNVHCSQNLWR